MLGLFTHKPLLRLVTLLTVLGFFPSAAGAWNFVPEETQAVVEQTPQADAPAAQMPAPVSVATNTADPYGPRLLASQELERIAGGPRQQMLVARASLPSPVELLAGVTAAMAGAVDDGKGPYAPYGPQEAVTALAEADAFRTAGHFSEAAAAYVALMDAYPGTEEAGLADKGLKSVARATVEGGLTEAEVAAIDAALPTWESLSAAGRYVLQDFYWMRAEVAYEADSTDALNACYAQNRELAMRFLREHPDEPLALPVALELYDSQDWATKHGLTTRGDAIAELGKLATSETPGPARMGANCALTNYYLRVQRDFGATHLHNANILNELDYDYLDKTLDDPYVQYWIKALIGLAVGTALLDLGRLEEALEWYKNPAFHIRKRCHATRYIDFDVARIKQRLQPQDPAVAIEAYQAFIDAHPDCDLTPMARLEFGNIFMTAGDYPGAADLYQQVIKYHPGTEAAAQAENELSFIMTYLYDSVEVANGQPVAAATDDGTAVANLCGPKALHRLLAGKGIDASVDELAQLAGTDDTGTTMAGLIQASEAKGVKLVGVEALEPQQLDTPFIAYVNGNHFVLVTEAKQNDLSVSDQGQDPTPMDLAAFDRVWDGKALVIDGAPKVARLLETATLKGSKGGGGGGGGGDTTPTENKCSCVKVVDSVCCKEKCQTVVKKTQEPIGKPWTRLVNQDSCECRKGKCDDSGCGGSPTANAGIRADGVNPTMYPMGTQLLMDESDLAASIVGGMQLQFRRSYSCAAGFANSEYSDATKVWANLGKGWNHGYSAHLRTSVPTYLGYPLTVLLYAEGGAPVTYAYTASTATENQYRIQNATAEETNFLLTRDKTSGEYTLYMPDGSSYEFSVPTGSPDYYARLEAASSPDGNTISLSYDAASVATGKLTKVSPPAGDTRYLQFSYSGNMLTKAELKDSTTVLQTFQYEYNATSDLTKVIDSASQAVEYGYATSGLNGSSRYMTKVTDKAGVESDFTWTFGYSSALSRYEAYKIAVDNAAGLTTEYERSLSTHVTAITNKSGATTLSKIVMTPVTGTSDLQYEDYYYGDLTSYERWGSEYDAVGAITRETGPGSVTLAEYAYDATSGHLTTGTGRDGRIKRFYYASSTAHTPTKVTNYDGLDTFLYYDANDRVTKEVQTGMYSDGIRYTFDALGHVITKTDPLGLVSTFGYDAKGNMTATTDSDGNTTTNYYDAYGNVTKVTDPRSNDTFYYYVYGACGSCGGASSGRLTKITDPLGNDMTMEHDVNGNMTRQTSASGIVTTYAYDAVGNVTSVTNDGNTTTFAHDIRGRMTSTTSPTSEVTTFEYDHLGRTTKVTTSLGDTTTTHDSLGNVLSTTDPMNRTTNYYYDAYLQLTKVSDPVGDVIFGYDSRGNQTTVTDGLNHTTTYALDSANRLTKVTDAVGKMTCYFYDEYGRKTKVGAGATGTVDPTENFYDNANGRLTKVRYTAGGSTYDADYAFDGYGQLTNLTDWIDAVDGLEYAYDQYGRLTQLTDYDGTTLDYAYDSLSRITSMNDYFSHSTTYTYTDAGQVSTITAPGSKTWTYAYNALGQPTSVAIPNGMTTEYGYDTRNRLTKIEHKDGATVLDGFTYALDNGGNITTTTHADSSLWDYEYDGRSRLTKAERYDTDGTTLLHRYSYTYDDGDNLLTKAVYDGSTTTTTAFAVNNANEMTSRTIGATTTTYAYDALGRMTSGTDGTYTAAFTYGPAGMLSTFTSDFPTQSNATYVTGGDGKRRSRTVGGTETWYNWAGMSVINEENSAGVLTRTYFGHTAAHVDGTSPATGDYAYYFHDHLGSARHVRNQDKSSFAEFEYDPYGGTYASSGSTSSVSHQYAMLDWDDAPRLYFAPYRYYGPAGGRWLTRDPLGMIDGANVHQYAGSRPTSSLDPLGLSWKDWFRPDNTLGGTDINITIPFLPIAAFGISFTSCCDDDGNKWKARYRKICGGIYFGGSVAAHKTLGHVGDGCVKQYEGWFGEVDVSIPLPIPNTGGLIGAGPSAEFSEDIAGVGVGIGVGFAPGGFCHYKLLGEPKKVGKCCES